MMRCLWCDGELGRARVVTDTDQPMLAVWHARCWGPWVREQGFRRGRRPSSRAVTAAELVALRGEAA